MKKTLLLLATCTALTIPAYSAEDNSFVDIDLLFPSIELNEETGDYDTVHTKSFDGSWSEKGSGTIYFAENEGVLESWTLRFTLKGLDNTGDTRFFGTYMYPGGFGIKVSTVQNGTYSATLCDCQWSMNALSDSIEGLSTEDLVTFIVSFDSDSRIATLNIGETTVNTNKLDASYDHTALVSGFHYGDGMEYASYISFAGNVKAGNFLAADTPNAQMPAVVPEPATATLSLLALAGLCARRRRTAC